MNLRAVTLLLALSTGLFCAPVGVDAQARLRGAGGFYRGAGPGFGAQNFPRPNAGRQAGYGLRPFGPGGYGPGDGRNARPPAGYARAPFNGVPYPAAPYGQGSYGPPAYGARPYAPAYPPPPYGPPGFGGNWRQEQNEVRQAVRDGRHIPLGQAIEAVRRRSPGRELDADLVQGADGRPAYRLRWAASNGRRIDYLVDAATGAIVGAEGAR